VTVTLLGRALAVVFKHNSLRRAVCVALLQTLSIPLALRLIALAL
jgi:hypothetical protein